MKCDFCSDPGATWTYASNSFIMDAPDRPGTADLSSGSWAACDVCHDLIESGSVMELVKRAVEKAVYYCPSLAPDAQTLFTQLADVHLSFFENRTGPAAPISPEESATYQPPDSVSMVVRNDQRARVIRLADAGLTPEETAAAIRNADDLVS